MKLNCFHDVHKWLYDVEIELKFWEFQLWTEKFTKATEKTNNTKSNMLNLINEVVMLKRAVL